MSATRTTLKPLLSTRARVAAAIAVAAVLAPSWLVAEQASHQAVQSAKVTFQQPVHIMLTRVEIVAQRDPS